MSEPRTLGELLVRMEANADDGLVSHYAGYLRNILDGLTERLTTFDPTDPWSLKDALRDEIATEGAKA